MHELLLFAQVPPSKHSQLLAILAGISAMQPQPILERHLIFKPKRPGAKSIRASAKPGAPGSQAQALQAQMQGDLFYLQLVGNVPVDGSSGLSSALATAEDAAMGELMSEGGTENNTNNTSAPNTADGSPTQAIDFSAHPWTIEFRDLPEVPGRRPVTSRLMASIAITDGNPMRVIEALGYTYVSEYALHGHRFIHNNILLLLHRPFVVPASTPGSGPANALPPLQSLRPLDPSGGYILQASIRVQDGTKPESMTLGINELVRFRDLVKGVVDLEVGDRLALDTRLR